MTKKRKEETFRKSAIALGVALMFTAGVAVATPITDRGELEDIGTPTNGVLVLDQPGTYEIEQGAGTDHYIDLTDTTPPSGALGLSMGSGITLTVVGSSGTAGPSSALATKNVTVTGGTLNATGGTGEASAGIYITEGGLKVSGGTVTAQGMGESGGTNYWSQGIYILDGGLNQTGGTINALGSEELINNVGIHIAKGGLEQIGTSDQTVLNATGNTSGGLHVEVGGTKKDYFGAGNDLEFAIYQGGAGKIVAKAGDEDTAHGISIQIGAGDLVQSGGLIQATGLVGMGIAIDGYDGSGFDPEVVEQGILQLGGKIEATGGSGVGAATGATGISIIYGDYIKIAGELDAKGGSLDGTHGIHLVDGDLVQEAGKITATGGSAAGAFGITIDGTEVEEYQRGNLIIKDGDVIATAGNAESAHGVVLLLGDLVQEEGAIVAKGAGYDGGSGDGSIGIVVEGGNFYTGGSVTATGGIKTGTKDGAPPDYDSAEGSAGIRVAEDLVQAETGVIVATGGDDAGAHGIYIAAGDLLAGGKITATGGAANGAYGIWVEGDDPEAGDLVQAGEDSVITARGGTVGGAVGIVVTDGNLIQTSGEIHAFGSTTTTANGAHGILIAQGDIEQADTITATGGAGLGSHGIVLESGNVSADGALTATGGSGAEAAGIYILSGNLIQNSTDSLITAAGGPGTGAIGIVLIDGDITQNAGEIRASASKTAEDAHGILVTAGSITVESDIVAVGGHTASHGIVIELGGINQNDGTITATGGASAGSHGIVLLDGTIDQDGGLIKASGAANAASHGIAIQEGNLDVSGDVEAKGVGADSVGIAMENGELIVRATGTVQAEGGSGTRAAGIVIGGAGGGITNAGTIEAIGVGNHSVGILLLTGDLTNSGELTATAGSTTGSHGIIISAGQLLAEGGTIEAKGGTAGAVGIVIQNSDLVQRNAYSLITARAGTGEGSVGISIEDGNLEQTYAGAVIDAIGSAHAHGIHVSGDANIAGTLNVRSDGARAAVYVEGDLTVASAGTVGVYADGRTDRSLILVDGEADLEDAYVNITSYEDQTVGTRTRILSAGELITEEDAIGLKVGGVDVSESIITFALDIPEGTDRLEVVYGGLNTDVWVADSGVRNEVKVIDTIPVYVPLVGTDPNTGLKLIGGGTLELYSTDTRYSGGTEIQYGTLSIGDDRHIGEATAGENIIHPTGTLELREGGTYTHSWKLEGTAAQQATIAVTATDADAVITGDLYGPAGLVKEGAGTLVLTGDNDYGGDTDIVKGTLSIYSDGNIGKGTNTIYDGARLQLGDDVYAKGWTLGAAAGDESSIIVLGSATMEGNLTGAGGLVKEGSGVLVLSGTNNYLGTTTIDAGTLSISSANNIGADDIYIGNATLQLTNQATLLLENDVILTADAATIKVDTSEDAIIGGDLYGSAILVKDGAGTLVLAGDDNSGYDGNVIVSDGVLQLADGFENYEGKRFDIGTGAVLDVATGLGDLDPETGEYSYDGGIYGETLVLSSGLTQHFVGSNTLVLEYHEVIDGSHSVVGGPGQNRIGEATIFTNSQLSTASVGSGTAAIGKIIMHGGTTVDVTTPARTNVGQIDVHHARDAGPGRDPLTGVLQSDLKISGAGNELKPEGITFHLVQESIGESVPAVLSLTGAPGTLNLTDANIALKGLENTDFAIGDVVNLIAHDGNLKAPDGEVAYNLADTQLVQGVTELVNDDGLYRATGVRTEAAPRAKTLAEGYVTGVALVNQGADVVAGLAVSNAVEATATGANAFAAVQGGRNNYDVGSKSKLDSVAFLLGAANGWAVSDSNRMTVGGFIEYGTGSYDTEHSFADGKGHSYYYGLGGLARLDIGVAGGDRAYVEGSVRLGQVKNRDDGLFNGGTASYDASSMYYGLHVGGGYILNISEKSAIDLYGKYLWTRVASETTDVKNDGADNVHFNGVNSHRTRLGGRYIYQATSAASVYGGLAWEHEFDAKAKSTVNYNGAGYTIGVPDLKGSSAMLEAGVRFTPSDAVPLYIDLGLTGYLGKRDGIMGNLRVNYRF